MEPSSEETEMASTSGPTSTLPTLFNPLFIIFQQWRTQHQPVVEEAVTVEDSVEVLAAEAVAVEEVAAEDVVVAAVERTETKIGFQ